MKYRIKSPDGRTLEVAAPEGASEAQVLAYAKANMPPPKEPEKPSLAEQRKRIGGDTLKLGPFDTGIELSQGTNEALAGMGRRFSQIGTLGRHKTDPKTAELLNDSGYATLGGAGADLATLLAGGPVLKAIGAGAVVAPKTLAQAVGGGAAYGAATSENRAAGALGGATGGALGRAVPVVGSKVVKPTLQKGADALTKNKVSLTIGEALGGWAKRIEDAASSLPVLGDAIKGAQTRSLASWGRSMVDDALSPLGKSLPKNVPAGRGAIEAADNIVSDAYESALRNMDVKVDARFIRDMDSLVQLAEKLPPAQNRKFLQVINDKLYKHFDNPNQLLLGKTLKEVDSALRWEYKRFLKAGDPMQQDLGDALRTAHLHLMDMAKRQNPQNAALLHKADIAYAKMSRISEAASYKGAREGIFTPDHLLNAIKKSTSTKQYARGDGFNQKAVETAKEIMVPSIPDSGTGGRLLTNAALLGGTGYISPAAALSLIGGAGAYTQAGQKVVTPLLTARPYGAENLAQALLRYAPKTGVIGTAIGTNQ